MSKDKGLNILLIDDKKDLALNISDILEDNGYRTDLAFNGSEAISIVKKKGFDLAIVDLKLPDIFGLDLIEKLSLISPKLEYIVLKSSMSLTSCEERLAWLLSKKSTYES